MKIFLNLLILSIICVSSYAENFDTPGDYYTNSFYGDDFMRYVNIANGATVNASSGGVIVIEQPGITINNHGIITADIDTDYNSLRIQNDGEIWGDIITYTDAQVTQIIQSASDIHSLNVCGNHTLVLDMNNFNGMANLSQLKGLANIGVVNMTNSSIIMDDFSEWQNWDMDINLSGINTLYITNPETAHSGDVIAHVVNPANIHVVLLNSGNLYTVTIKSLGTGAELYIVRETDYDKVFNDEENNVFQNLRDNHIDDKLLNAMDSASNINELHEVMNASHRFNHSILMQPVRAITNFSLLNLFDEEHSLGLRFSPSYISSQDFGGYELRTDLGFLYKDFYFDIGLFFNQFDYENDFNYFNGSVYGSDVRFKKYISSFWVKGVVGFSLTDFNTDYVYTDNGMKNNPYGYSLYGGFDGGYDYKGIDDFVITPFSGIVLQNMKVLDFSDYDVSLRGGGNVKYSFGVDSIKYEYSVGGAIATNGDIFCMLKIGFVSVPDGAGVSVGLDVIKNEYDLSYRASISGKVLF